MVIAKTKPEWVIPIRKTAIDLNSIIGSTASDVSGSCRINSAKSNREEPDQESPTACSGNRVYRATVFGNETATGATDQRLIAVRDAAATEQQATAAAIQY
ncbi:hypothetical protein ACHAXS_000692 [Conticribra weissflogii]